MSSSLTPVQIKVLEEETRRRERGVKLGRPRKYTGQTQEERQSESKAAYYQRIKAKSIIYDEAIDLLEKNKITPNLLEIIRDYILIKENNHL